MASPVIFLKFPNWVFILSHPFFFPLKSATNTTLQVTLPSGEIVPLLADIRWIQGAQVGLTLGEFIPRQWTELLDLIENDVISSILKTTELQQKNKKIS